MSAGIAFGLGAVPGMGLRRGRGQGRDEEVGLGCGIRIKPRRASAISSAPGLALASLVVGDIYNQVSQLGIQTNDNRVCVLGRGYQHRDIVASLEGLGVLPAVQDRNLLSPGCAFTVEGAVAESRGDRDTTLQLHNVEPEQAPDYHRLRWVHYSMLLRCLGWRERKRDDHTLSRLPRQLPRA